MWFLFGRRGQVMSSAAVYRQEIPARTRPHYWWVPVLFCKFVMSTVRCELVSLLYGPLLPLYLSLSFVPSLTHSLPPSLYRSLSLSLFSQGWSLEREWSTLMGSRSSYKFGTRQVVLHQTIFQPRFDLTRNTITPRGKPFHSPTKSNRCGEKWSSSDRLSYM